jgi:hypothetical protein
MQKELILKKNKEQILIVSDDLKFDGKNIIIPSYYSSLLLDYISRFDPSKESKADAEDFAEFKKFLKDIEDYKESRYSSV